MNLQSICPPHGSYLHLKPIQKFLVPPYRLWMRIKSLFLNLLTVLTLFFTSKKSSMYLWSDFVMAVFPIPLLLLGFLSLPRHLHGGGCCGGHWLWEVPVETLHSHRTVLGEDQYLTDTEKPKSCWLVFPNPVPVDLLSSRLSFQP